MTKEEFENARFCGKDIIEWEGHIGHVTMVDFNFGIIHHTDMKKGSHYGHHYSELQYTSS